ncbi:MAG TPA: 30S ribosomal protein S8 [Candidatus Saccharimonadales bacterium]|nr:30S ribosomal protein S8 [Candidatus Saccharimonadales bacterium]
MNSVIATDPIADMLTRIRNAAGARKTTVSLPHSNIKEGIARLLANTHFIDSVSVSGESIDKVLTLTLHGEHENSRITEIVRLSKPGRREYVTAQEIPTIKRGRGIVIVSTSKGLLTGEEAKKAGVGGELLCKVY